jgi:fucose permease
VKIRKIKPTRYVAIVTATAAAAVIVVAATDSFHVIFFNFLTTCFMWVYLMKGNRMIIS